MCYLQLYNRANVLAIRCNRYEIVHDLPYMTEFELLGVINFLSHMQGS